MFLFSDSVTDILVVFWKKSMSTLALLAPQISPHKSVTSLLTFRIVPSFKLSPPCAYPGPVWILSKHMHISLVTSGFWDKV